MQVVYPTAGPQELKLMLTTSIDEIVLTDEAENVSVSYTDFDAFIQGFYWLITIEMNLVNNRFYKLEAKSKGELICYDKVYCTDGTDNRYTQRTIQNTFITL